MKNKKLKSALETVYMQEMYSYPPEYELEKQHSFSAAFKAEMKQLTKETNKLYITVYGNAIPRNTLVIVLSALIIIPVCRLYFADIVKLSTARLIIAIAETILLYAFGTNLGNASRSFTRSYKTAFTDSDDEDELPRQLDFALPEPPDGYTKTSEYRTTVSHTAEYTDSLGRAISYSRIDIKQGVMTRIDTGGVQLTQLEINGKEAVCFMRDGVTNIVWADKHYRYHIKGNCSPDKLIKMAQSI